MALPGRAQETSGGRYFFADTTLLRDTLNLRFTRLFPLADSLEITPDSLRALSIRYRFSLERLVVLADSLGQPVDSVGPILERERFNPLAVGAGVQQTDFTYNSSYATGQTSSGWRNSGDFSYRAGAAFVQNSTSIQMDRYGASNGTSLQQSRDSATELGWRFNPNFSLGGRASLHRYDSRDVSSGKGISETRNEYQLSMRTRQQPIRGMSSTFNLFAGLLDLHSEVQEKRGLSGNVTSRLRYNYRSWLVQEVNGVVDGNLSHTTDPAVGIPQNTQDFSANVRGLLTMFQSSAAGLKSNFSYNHVQVETPDAVTHEINRVLTDKYGIDGTVRLRQDNDRYVDLTQRTSSSKQATVLGNNSRNTRREDGFAAAGRYLMGGWSLEPRFANSFATSDFPTRSDSGGYSEFLHLRSLDGTLTKQISLRVNLQITGSIGLSSFRYTVIGKYPTIPVSRDQWRQSWRAKASYAKSDRFSTSIALEVAKNSLINIPSASTGTNSGTRSYRSEWGWSFRLLPGLTATQINTIVADYLEYPFFPDNNRLTLDYANITTLNAVVTPRLNISVTHNTRQTPGGNYTRYPDQLYYFERADENNNASLRASINYTPTPAISFSFRPSYLASDRVGTVNGVEVPMRTNRTLDFSGGADISVPIGLKGTLRANVARTYRAERSTTYSSGVPRPSPLSEIDYWNGSVQLSWTF